MTYIAGGCSTYSKTRYADVEGYPDWTFLADGAMLYTKQGPMLDTWSALGSNILGYKNSRVQNEMAHVVHSGLINTSIPNDLEEDTAETLCTLTGWDQCRFAKNGSDVTEAAVRLARFVTGITHIITNSYHGSHSDLLESDVTKNNGLAENPNVTQLTFTKPEDILLAVGASGPACVLVEPYHPSHGEPWPWHEIKDACEQAGSLLIFDEMITGFRSAPGGYAAVCGVKPHLACYGKALANGMPLAAICGPRELMQHFEHDVFMSGTAAAEGLSLAAANACLEVQQKD